MENRKFPKYMDSEMVTARDIAPVVRMHPQVIVKYAKDGKWPREICNYIVSGSRVKFFRRAAPPLPTMAVSGSIRNCP